MIVPAVDSFRRRLVAVEDGNFCDVLSSSANRSFRFTNAVSLLDVIVHVEVSGSNRGLSSRQSELDRLTILTTCQARYRMILRKNIVTYAAVSANGPFTVVVSGLRSSLYRR